MVNSVNPDQTAPSLTLFINKPMYSVLGHETVLPSTREITKYQ